MSNEDDRKDVATAVTIVVQELEKKGLISIYLAGSLFTEDSTPESDIDLFAIVSDGFDLYEEHRVNIRLAKLPGRPVGFRAIPLSALRGGEQRGVITIFKPQRFLKRFPFFTHLWGMHFSPNDFFLPPFTFKEDALLHVKQLRESLRLLRAGAENFPYKDILKHVANLAILEAEKEKNYSFNPSYAALARHVVNEQDHIIHDIIRLRRMKCTRADIMHFCTKADEYISNIEQLAKNW